MALALALRARGAEPIICSHDNFQPKVESIGIPFQSFGPGYQTYRDDLKISQDELVRRMSRDHAYMLRLLVAPYLSSAVQDLMPLVRDADMVVGSRYAYGAHIAARLCGKPYTALALQPAVMLSAYDPPKLKDAFFNTAPRGALGRTHNRVIKLIGTGLLASGLGPVSKIYQSFGLEPQDRIDGIVADQQTLALYSPLIGKLQPDFPPRTQIVGFPFFDSESGASARLEPALEAFLSSGTPPLVFSLGSVAVFDSIAFYRDAIQACKELGERCVILAGDSPLLEESFGPDVFVTRYAPHSLLFPRAGAVIHHGGIGSTAQGLRAGRPQLITPVFADQFDNAHRLEKLGLCRSVDFDAWSVSQAKAAISAVLASPELARRAADVAPIIAAENGAERAADIIMASREQILSGRGREAEALLDAV
jgi:UDP:flavonoid glycosyltransferase YjiC (YdhE family)